MQFSFHCYNKSLYSEPCKILATWKHFHFSAPALILTWSVCLWLVLWWSVVYLQVLIQAETTAAGKHWLLIWSLPVTQHNSCKSLTNTTYSQFKVNVHCLLEIGIFLELTQGGTKKKKGIYYQLLNPLTTDDTIWRRLTLAACYQLAQSVSKIGFALAKKAG